MNMRSMFLGGATVLAAAASIPDTAYAQRANELEAARANARAGGALSEQDNYLLNRYGALSGTRGWSPGGTYRLRPHSRSSYYHKRKRRYY